jgi:hypothetical protein
MAAAILRTRSSASVEVEAYTNPQIPHTLYAISNARRRALISIVHSAMVVTAAPIDARPAME